MILTLYCWVYNVYTCDNMYNSNSTKERKTDKIGTNGNKLEKRGKVVYFISILSD